MKRLLAYVLIFTAPCLLLGGCKSKKDIVASGSVDIDSLCMGKSSGYILKIDTAIRRLNFTFDTLDIAIERQVAADTTHRVRIRAVKGSVIDNRKQVANDIEGYNRLDTVAYKRASATSRAEHTATTSIAEPPNTTLIFSAIGCVIIIVVGVFVYLRHRRK